LKITLEVASGKGDDFMFRETDVLFEYEADFEKYSRDGEVYRKGKGAFNDFKTYEIVENKGFSQELSLFRIYEVKSREEPAPETGRVPGSQAPVAETREK
jgi:hypothetical protein